MDNSKAQYHLDVSDSLNGLVISYQRNQNWHHTIYSFIVSAILFVFLTWALAQVQTFFSSGAETSTWIISLVVIGAFLFTMLREISAGVDSLLTIEKIQVDDRSIQVEKSGFRSMTRSQTFATEGKANFFLGRGFQKTLAFHTSKIIAQFYSTGMLYINNLDPMRCFLRGISPADAIEVLEKIKTRFPQYNIYYHNPPSINGT
ncbi:MAG: hypothetical protein JW704_02860 [Anaerolineaceae bacterium]|nr:hypothetical protein [Anaerolineaceae bacterium]